MLAQNRTRYGTNWYAYCGGNPVNRFDWTGLEDAPFNWSVGKYDKAYIIKGVDTGDKWYNNAADITINAAAGIWNAAAMNYVS